MKTFRFNLWNNGSSWEDLYPNAIEYIIWCKENCQDEVYIGLYVTDFDMDGEVIVYTPEEFEEHLKWYLDGNEALDEITLQFKSEEDATLFKLTWM